MSNVGDTFVYDLKCYDQDNKLFDPDVVEVSIVYGSGAEELITYGGTETRDNWISKTATGVYALVIASSSGEPSSILPRWKHHTTLGDGTLVVTSTRPYAESFLGTKHQFKDRT